MMLKGMSIQQYAEIVEFVQKNHQFAGLAGDRIPLKEYFHIKYIDNVYDSRNKQVWSISFRGLGTNVRFSTNHFVMSGKKPDNFKYTTLYDWIMGFLKCEWKPSQKELRILSI